MKLAILIALALALTGASASLAAEQGITVTSSAFQEGGNIPAQFTCKGSNANPPLRIASVPANAKGLAIAVTDPDAPGGRFTHWLVWNIDPKTSAIAEKSVPAGAVQGTNDFGKPGYGGPCPPSGTHRYYFRVFALDSDIQLKSGAKMAEFEKAIAGHVIGRGQLMGRFSH